MTMRTMLIIGATREDAYAFVGQKPDDPAGTPSADDRPSLLVPEDAWPTGETFNGYFTDGWPTGRAYDLVIVTAAARAACGHNEAAMREWSAEMLTPEGKLYLQPLGGR